MYTTCQIKDSINFTDFENQQINELPEEKNIKQSKTLTKNNIINNLNKCRESSLLPIQFNINFYLNKSKPSAFTPFHQSDYICPQYINNVNQKNSKFYIFKMSLLKSGFKFSQKKNNNTAKTNKLSINNNTNNNYPQNEFSNLYCHNFQLNNNVIFYNSNNIVNNFYTTLNKLNDVQMYSEAYTRENSGIKLNSNEFIEERISEIDCKEKYENSEKYEDYKNSSFFSNKKPKIIFECSNTKNSDIDLCKKFLKKKRLRKNNNQIICLSKFFKENKHWSKKQIKEISGRIGLKEKKIYKWLWDQKNKEYKTNKFIVSKNNNKESIF